jgi:hypothetical protein
VSAGVCSGLDFDEPMMVLVIEKMRSSKLIVLNGLYQDISLLYSEQRQYKIQFT